MRSSTRSAIRGIGVIAFALGLGLALGGGWGVALAQDQDRSGPRILLVRVHGNHSTPDEQVLGIAGIRSGDAFSRNDVAHIQKRLVASGKFSRAEVRVRYRSLDESGDVALVIVVREKRSFSSRIMVAPIVGLSDEYGWTLGATPAVVDAGTEGARLAFPMSWGGDRRAGAQSVWPLGERTRQLHFGVSRWRRENPHFDAPENRFELDGGYRAQQGIAKFELGAGVSNVEFLSVRERMSHLRAGVALDSRIDSTVPGDAFYAGIGWRRLFFEDERADAHQLTFDVRGYKRLFGQLVIAAQGYYRLATEPLPPYAQPFIGGGMTLRGSAPGRYIGDSAATGTLELRVPLTSTLSAARAGLHAFFDTAAVHDHGTSLRKARFHHGAGVGAFFRFAIIGVRVDFGLDLEGGTRWHVGSGFKF